MMAILLLCLALIIGVLAWKQARYAITLVVICLPLYTIRTHWFGIPVTALEVLLCAASLPIIVRALRRASIRQLWCKHKLACIGVAAWLYIWTLSLFYSPSFVAAAGIWKAYGIEACLFGIAIAITIRQSKDYLSLIYALGFSGACVAVLCIVQYITGWGIPETWQAISDRRATAHYGFPNAVGLYLAPIAALTLGAAWSGDRLITSRLSRALLLFCALLCIAGSVAARADGALVALCAVVICILIIHKRYSTLATLLCAGAILWVSMSAIQETLTFQDTSGQVRIALWTGTIRLLGDHPLMGSGLAHFASAYDQYRLDSHVELLEYSHQLFLDFWAQLGILGLLWIISALVYFFVTIRKLFVYPRTRIVAVSGLCFGIVFIIYGLVDVPYFKNDLSALFWMMLGILYSISYANTPRLR